MSRTEAMLAAVRFGLGADGPEAEAVGDPRGWLKAQLAPDRNRYTGSGLTSEAAFRSLQTRLGIKRAQRRGGDEAASVDPNKALEAGARGAVEVWTEIAARTAHAIATTDSFHERLVRFWSNHFSVAATKIEMLPIAATFETEAIRPRMHGRFADLALAAASHPAMLLYLDNARSVGPNSPAGKRRGLGLNENLARESLELHTLGVGGGYGQADVESLAKALTGWTVGNERIAPEATGRFTFAPILHEPGARTVMGKRYPDDGEGQARAIIADAARHPSTARHVAAKLARHFIADEPPPGAVERLARVFEDNEGDLPALHTALVDLDAAWSPELVKFKTPEELVISAQRALGEAAVDPITARRMFKALGQEPFYAPSPAGWPDHAEAWVSADAIKKRLEWSLAAGRRAKTGRTPSAILDHALGPLASAATIQTIARAETAAQGLALLFMSPEFQRR